MKYRFHSLALELIIVFVAALAVSQIASLVYRYNDRTNALVALEAMSIADRISTLVPVLNRSNPMARDELVQSTSGSFMPVALSGKSWLGADTEQDDHIAFLQKLLADSLRGVSSANIRVGYTANSLLAQHQMARLSNRWKDSTSLPPPLNDIVEEFLSDPTYLVSVRLEDGTWLNATAAYAETLEFWPLKSIAFLVGMVAAIAFLSIWAIRSLTAPFRRFADAAARLGTDVNAPPLEERGSREVQGAIQAFNGMQRRLQKFLEDRTLMLAGVSHDLRTPVTRLKLRVEFIEDANQRKKAKADLDEMESMIAGFMTFAREDNSSEASVIVDLASLIRRIGDEMTDEGRDVAIEDSAPAPLLGRPHSLRRCFLNIIENAVRYGKSAAVSLKRTGTDIVVFVDDAGPGIPTELHEQVFRPFFRLETSRNRESGGAGLGLSVARSIARSHGGDVKIENRGEGGLRATVILPTNFAERYACAAE